MNGEIVMEGLEKQVLKLVGKLLIILVGCLEFVRKIERYQHTTTWSHLELNWFSNKKFDTCKGHMNLNWDARFIVFFSKV